MAIYADSSFLVSCYMQDANTPSALAILKTVRPVIPFTSLHRLEVENAFELAHFRSHIDRAGQVLARKLLANDVAGRRLFKQDVDWHTAFDRAFDVSRAHSRAIGSRSLDVLHIACALTLKSDQFISFDVRQRALAKLVGMLIVSAR